MNIEPIALKQLIESDSIASSLFENKSYGDCAIRCCEIAPKVYRQLRLSKIGVLDVYRDNRSTGHLVLRRLAELAKTNPDAEIMLEFMGPGNPESSYPDFALPEIRMALTAPSPYGLGLTQEQAMPLLLAGEQPDTITGLDVEQLQGIETWQQL